MLCDVDGCEELARYVETGDGRRVRDPDVRCHGHHSTPGLWRDMRTAVAPAYEVYQEGGDA